MTNTASDTPASPRATRGRLINLRVSDEEHRAFIAKAKASGRPLSALVRDLLADAAMRHRDDERRLIYEVNKVGVNLNQIAHMVNATKGAVETREVLLYLDTIATYLDRLMQGQEA